jgi:hypothetical protein
MAQAPFDKSAAARHGSQVTTTPSPTPPLNGHDLLRSLELPIEGPILWGRPVAANGPGVFIVELPAPQSKVAVDPAAVRGWLDRAPDLRLDGKRPTVAELQTRLASFWLPGQVILFIGSSQKSVGARLSGIYKTPLGERRPQPAGYWLKTLRQSQPRPHLVVADGRRRAMGRRPDRPVRQGDRHPPICAARDAVRGTSCPRPYGAAPRRERRQGRRESYPCDRPPRRTRGRAARPWHPRRACSRHACQDGRCHCRPCNRGAQVRRGQASLLSR